MEVFVLQLILSRWCLYRRDGYLVFAFMVITHRIFSSVYPELHNGKSYNFIVIASTSAALRSIHSGRN